MNRIPWNLVGLGALLGAMGLAVWSMRRRARAEDRHTGPPGGWDQDP